MKFYWRCARKETFLACLFQVLQRIGMVAWNLLMIYTFQAVIELNMRRAVLGCGLQLLVSALRKIFICLETRFQSRAIQRMNGQLRQDIAYSLIKKSNREYHSQNSSEYLSQLTNDVAQIEQLVWKPFFDLVGCVAETLVSMVALVSMHWTLLAASLLTAAVMLLLPNLFQKPLEQASAFCAAEQAAAVGRFRDMLAGYDVFMFFGRTKQFMSQTNSASEQIEKPRVRQVCMQTNISSVLDLVSTVIQLLLYLWICYLAIAGIIIQSAPAGGGNLCGSVYTGICQLMSYRLSFASGKPYFDKITVHAAEVEAAPAALPALQQGITVEDVSFCYDEKKPILQHTSIEFKKGGKYALTGPSGCGKSTLLKILLGWLPGYEGTVRFDGHDMRDYSPEQLQQQMSYIEQDVFLFNTSIRENITLGENFSDEEMQKALRDSALAGDLANMPQGLDTPVGEEGSALSGGQKQRVAIARALIHKRSILLVDEGTSALDQKNADIVEKSLLANPGLTLILISHHLSDARKAQFDRVYELKPVALTA